MSIEPGRNVSAQAAPRILIVRVGAMGDVIHALPAVAYLRAALPDAHIGWAIEPRWAPLLRAGEPPARHEQRMPLVDEVHPVEAKLWNRDPLSRATIESIGALRESLRGAQYDIAIDLQGTLRSAAIARIGGNAPAFGSDTPRENAAKLFYKHRVVQTGVHVVDRGLELVQAALQGLSSGGKRPHSAPLMFPHDPNAEAWWYSERERLCADRPMILLAATAGWGAKEWPPEQFAALALELARRGYCVLLNTTPGSVDPVTARVLQIAEKQGSGSKANIHALGATLPQLIAATRSVAAVVAGDTGPLHLADALGVPTVGLFGPTAPERTGPRGQGINLRDPASVTDHRRHATVEAGLARLSVDQVMDALDQVLAGSPGMR